jgi:hypothetical protein
MKAEIKFMHAFVDLAFQFSQKTFLNIGYVNISTIMGQKQQIE